MEALAERLKEARNRKADELGLPRGTLLSNATLLEIARAAPRSIEALASVEGVRPWKAEALGEEFLRLIRGRA
jgi:ribonuclease D